MPTNPIIYEHRRINSNRLTQILTGITSGEPNSNIIQGFVQNFIEDFKPDYYYEISVTDVEGYTPTFIEY